MTEQANFNSENTLRSGKNGTSVKKNPFEKWLTIFKLIFGFFYGSWGNLLNSAVNLVDRPYFYEAQSKYLSLVISTRQLNNFLIYKCPFLTTLK